MSGKITSGTATMRSPASVLGGLNDSAPITPSACQLLAAALMLALGVLVLKEPVTLLVLAGIALILIGVAITRHSEQTSAADRAHCA